MAKMAQEMQGERVFSHHNAIPLRERIATQIAEKFSAENFSRRFAEYCARAQKFSAENSHPREAL
jgi:hypothetical protein